MATDPSFIEYVLDQADLGDRMTHRKMFGEYGFYLDGKFIGVACDGCFFIKPTDALSELDVKLPERPPYNGAKPYAVVDELLDDPVTLKRVLENTAVLLPAPKPKKPESNKPKPNKPKT